jgi:inhibitor of cysteine peptidase
MGLWGESRSIPEGCEARPTTPIFHLTPAIFQKPKYSRNLLARFGVNIAHNFRKGVAMVRRIFLVVVLAGMLVSAAGCSSSRIAVTSADNGKELNLKVGQQIVVVLEGNPTTGYTWEALDLDASMIQQVGSTEFKSSNTGLVGAGGTQTLVFKTLKAGTTNLTLIYHRPWETAVKPLQSFEMKIIVQ